MIHQPLFLISNMNWKVSIQGQTDFQIFNPEESRIQQYTLGMSLHILDMHHDRAFHIR